MQVEIFGDKPAEKVVLLRLQSHNGRPTVFICDEAGYRVEGGSLVSFKESGGKLSLHVFPHVETSLPVTTDSAGHIAIVLG